MHSVEIRLPLSTNLGNRLHLHAIGPQHHRAPGEAEAEGGAEERQGALLQLVGEVVGHQHRDGGAAEIAELLEVVGDLLERELELLDDAVHDEFVGLVDQEIVHVVRRQLIALHHLLDADGRAGDGEGEYVHAVDERVLGGADDAVAEVLLDEGFGRDRVAEAAVRGDEGLVAGAQGIELDDDVLGRRVILQGHGGAAVAEQGDAALVLHRAHPQGRVADQQQGALDVARAQQVAGHVDGVHAAAAAHRDVQHEGAGRQPEAVLQDARRGRRPVVAGHGTEHQHVDALFLPTQRREKPLGGVEAEVGGAHVVRADVAVLDADGVVEDIRFLLREDVEVGGLDRVVGNRAGDAADGYVLDFPACHALELDVVFSQDGLGVVVGGELQDVFRVQHDVEAVLHRRGEAQLADAVPALHALVVKTGAQRPGIHREHLAEDAIQFLQIGHIVSY